MLTYEVFSGVGHRLAILKLFLPLPNYPFPELLL